MRQKWIFITAILLLFTFPLTACGSSGNNTVVSESPMEDTAEVIVTNEVPKAGGDDSGGNQTSSGKIDNLVDFTDAWTELYENHESTVNEYTGMPIISLVMVGLPLANAIFYSLLNLENVDGEFSGKLGFVGTEGYYNKSGDVAEFGQDWIRDVDGAMSNDKVGDRVLTDGLFDAGKGYFRMDDSVMRDGKTISRTYTEFIRSKDGSFLCLYQVSRDLDYSGNEAKLNAVTFISMSEDHYNFVTADGTLGVQADLVKLEEGMTVAEAESHFLDLGYTIAEKGGIRDGVFVVN